MQCHLGIDCKKATWTEMDYIVQFIGQGSAEILQENLCPQSIESIYYLQESCLCLF